MTTFLATVFVLGVLIFIHELGHFLAAKRVGIRVERFSLGFPPKMIGFTKGDTEYCLSWIPLGGYVKMAGENPDDELSGKPWEFMSKSVWARTQVILAGPLANFVAAMVILAGVLYFHGEDYVDAEHVIVGLVSEGSAADHAGIQVGDVIVAIDDSLMTGFAGMASYVSARPGDTVEMVWTQGFEGDLYSKRFAIGSQTLTASDGGDSVVGRLGVREGFATRSVGGPIAAVVGGVAQTFGMSGAMLRFLKTLFTGETSIRMVSGPVGIAQMAGEVANEGFVFLLRFMAILSINLAILNVLPIPVLDGGHLIFLAAEVIRGGKPLSIKQRAISQQVGMVLLLALILTVTYNDILRILGIG